MNRFWLILLFFICSLFTVHCSLLWAEETVKLEEIVVTATRTEEEIEKIPANVTVITQEEIKNSTASTVQYLLKNEEGLIIRDLYGMGTKSTVDMRGFGRGLNTVILIDGRKVNEIDLSGVDWNTIPLENVERIEIVRGSGSVLYGDNAMAGTINIITKKGKTLKPEIELDAQMGSYGGDKEHFSVRGATKGLSYFLMAKHKESDGYRDNSEFRANDIDSNITVNITDNIYIDLRSGYHKDHQGLPGGLTGSELNDDRRQTTHPDDGVDYEQYFYGANLVFGLGWGDLEAGYNFNSRRFDSILAGEFFGFPYSSNTVRDTDTNEVKVKLSVRKKMFNHKNILVTGIDYSHSKVKDRNVFDFFGTFTTATRLSKQETGFYIEDEFFINDKWVLIAGYRYTNARYRDRIVTDFSSGSGGQRFHESAFRAGIAYNYADGAKVFANYSKGFRLPTTDELFAFDGTSVTIAPLKPERADTYEAGVVHPFSKDITARLTLFYMNVKDELFLNPSTGFFGANENIDRTRHQGVELGFSARLTDFLSLFGNGTYTRTTFESGAYEGKTMPLIPYYSANIGTEVKLKKAVAFMLKGNWIGERYIENDVENKMDKLPDYLTVDTKLSYQYKSVTAYIGINNMFNKKYNEYGVVGTSGNKNFYPAPERQFYGGIRINI